MQMIQRIISPYIQVHDNKFFVLFCVSSIIEAINFF